MTKQKKSPSKVEQYLDRLDRQILYELDRDSRIGFSELAKKIRHGRDTVEYRVQKLLERGIIRSFTVAINHYALGLQVHKTYLRLAFQRPQLRSFVEKLKRHPRVYWIAECDGQWDLIFSIVAENLFEFHRIQDEILGSIAGSVLDFDIFSLVNCWMYRKGYFVGKGGEPFLLGGEPGPWTLDELDARLLRVLSCNARISMAALARELTIHPMTATDRLAKLEERGIISGYRLEINLAELHMTFFKAQIYLRDYSAHHQTALAEYCQGHPHITCFIQQLGRCKLEIEMEADGYHHYSKIIDDIREKFAPMIRSIETNVVRSEHFNWVPGLL